MAFINLDNVSIEYPALTAREKSARVSLMHLGSGGIIAKDVKDRVQVKALNNVNISAVDGDRIALVGRNGAGKTTLLKLLGGVYEPTQGHMEVQGKTSSLLGMGLNLDPELSGIEAVKYSCMLKGVEKDRIAEIQVDVAEFTELGHFLNMPIRTYSAGMHMRLAFAIATANKPDILLMDEGIGAGDQFFLDKVKKRSEQFMMNANILFMASHSQMLLQEVCNKALLFEQGSVLAAGSLNDIFYLYDNLNKNPTNFPVTDINDADEPSPEPIASSSPLVCRDHYGSSLENPNNVFDGCPKTFLRLSSTQRRYSASTNEHSSANISQNKKPRKAQWVGLKYNTPKHPKTAFIRQKAENFFPANVSGRIAIDVSEDGFKTDIRTAAEADMPQDGSEVAIALSDIGAGRFWRVRSLDMPDTDQWDMVSVNFSNEEMREISNGGAISSGYAADGVEAFNAFDRNIIAPWVSNFSSLQVMGQAWIGWDFGRNIRKRVRNLEIQQWDGGQLPNTVKQVLLQSSNDGFLSEINTAAEFSLVQNESKQRFSIKTNLRARYWRVLAHSQTNGGRWGIKLINFQS